MSSRTPVGAVRSLVQQSQRIISCISDSVVLVYRDNRIPDQVFRIALGDGGFHPLRGDERLSISAMLYCRIVPAPDMPRTWQPLVNGYMYTLANAQFQEILAYHWHSDQRSHVNDPHIHLGAGAQVGFETLANAHIPTGYISLPDVIRMAISELKAKPLRDDWEAILDGAREVWNLAGS